MERMDAPILEPRDDRPAGHEVRLLAGPGAARFYRDHYEVRFAVAWRRSEYAAHEVFFADGPRFQMRHLSLRRCGRPVTRWTLRPGRTHEVRRLVRQAYRLRRPLRWFTFGRRFEVYFAAAPRQAARVRAALARV